MANDSLALADIPAELTQDADYDAVYAAVTATERGRWFLAEYANRNHRTETGAVVGAIARIEAAIRGDRFAPEPLPVPDIGAAAEKIGDIAVELREHSSDANLCDALDAAVRELCAVSGTTAKARGTNEFDETAATGSVPAPLEVGASEIVGATLSLVSAEEVPGEQLRASPCAQPPAVETASEAAEAGDAASETARTLVPSQDFVPSCDAPRSGLAQNGRRWHIEGPDFVFTQQSQPVAQPLLINAGHEDTPAESSALPPAEPLLPDPSDDPADLFEQTQAAAIAANGVVVEAPPPVSAPAQLRATDGTAIAVTPRPAAPDPLAPLRALSEEETIALFG